MYNRNMKKTFAVVGIVIFVLLVIVAGVIFLKPTANISFWLDEGDPGFENAGDIRKVLKQTLPDKEYTKLRYYKQHTDPNFKDSIYIEYVDELFSVSNLSKYANRNENTGEFKVLGSALCTDKNLRSKYGYKVLTFHVVSSESGPRKYYEGNWMCN